VARGSFGTLCPVLCVPFWEFLEKMSVSSCWKHQYRFSILKSGIHELKSVTIACQSASFCDQNTENTDAEMLHIPYAGGDNTSGARRRRALGGARHRWAKALRRRAPDYVKV